MKKFQFKLQSVLDARIKALENCQLAMALVQDKLNKQIKHLEYLYQTLKDSKNELELILGAGSNINLIEINSYQSFIIKLKDKIKDQHKLITDTEIELEEKKQAILQALKAKTMLEKLKEKNLKNFLTNVERLDFIEIDEIATNRHKRK
ncbi:MAG: flagellar export protein FliJ [Candidatus Gastranaerophilales bacterium]|nr:flagellar export protein FliJ [Candidatus Gastranaerophilales bacterium]